MFRNLIDFWRGKDFIQEIMNQFGGMLKDGKGMFESSTQKLLSGKEPKNLGKKIYQTDRGINLLERDIRKRILIHLAAAPTVKFPVCLILMSVAKDAERLGDYAKNLYEISGILDSTEEDIRKFGELFSKIHDDILEQFNKTRVAFFESNENEARQVEKIGVETRKTCDRLINEIANGNYTTRQAVAYALSARHFKRISGHLSNIASAVTLPLDYLDFTGTYIKETFEMDLNKSG